MNISEHHSRTIEKGIMIFKGNPDYQALIVGDSVVKGLARPDSDADLILVAVASELLPRPCVETGKPPLQEC